MQDGAGVRQMIEDELQRAGMRLRDLDVRLELGLQESVTSAVRGGYGVTFISRSSVENDLAAGTLVEARVAGLELEREIYLVRAAGRAETRAARAFVEFASERLAVIVRWSLAELPDALAEAGIERPFVIASERWHDLELPPHVGRLERGALRTRRGAAPAPTGSSRSAAARRSTPASTRRRRPGCRSCTCRRPTRAPSGRRSTASARPTGACRAAARARIRSRSSTTST